MKTRREPTEFLRGDMMGQRLRDVRFGEPKARTGAPEPSRRALAMRGARVPATPPARTSELTPPCCWPTSPRATSSRPPRVTPITLRSEQIDTGFSTEAAYPHLSPHHDGADASPPSSRGSSPRPRPSSLRFSPCVACWCQVQRLLN